MASIDAVNAILDGNSAWTKYMAQNPGLIDLTFADLGGEDLRYRSIERCNFSGAQLQSANLDHSKIDSCIFTGANLSSASLVGCELRKVEARNIVAKDIIFREASIFSMDLMGSNMSSATVASSTFHNCTFRNIHSDGLVFSSCKLEICIFSGLNLSYLHFNDCNMLKCNLSDLAIDDLRIQNNAFISGTIKQLSAMDSSLESSRFIDSQISDFSVRNQKIPSQHLDFSQSTISNTLLTIIGPNTATLLNTAIIFCTWPEQKGIVTPTGKYIASPFLLAQPVQDLRGIHPLLRREIADAQYLVKKIESCSGLGRFGMRLWGLCTGFGQSFIRLLLTTFGLITVATIMILAARDELIGGTPDFGLLVKAAQQAFKAFFALTNVPETSATAVLIVVILTRICGFLVLGFWVSILANKLSRLSSE